MKRIYLLLLTAVVLVTSCQQTAVQEKNALCFHGGKFRVAQFTDIHWDHNDTLANQAKTDMILSVIASERPDLCVLTGDIVTDAPGMEGLEDVIALFEKAGVPFAYLCGNHDVECMDADSLFDRLALSPFFVGEKGPEHLRGRGNYVIEVSPSNSPQEGEKGGASIATAQKKEGKKATPALLLYCINSGNHSDNREDSEYDWIRPETVSWYRNVSDNYKALNDNQPIPALAFFHICVPEYVTMRQSGEYEGSFAEDECPGMINGGFFGAAYEQGDIMGMFVGHDHANDYVGMHKGIMLAYGRQSGVNLNEEEATPMGCRMIELTEGSRDFTTWCATPAGGESIYYAPMGISTRDAETMPLHKATKVSADHLVNGISYCYYEGPFKFTTEVQEKGTLIESAKTDSIRIDLHEAEDHFAYLYRGYFLAPETGIYRFKLYSDDGSVLTIDGTKVIDNDGGHSARRAVGMINLEKGYHHFSLDYFENYMGQTLEVSVASLCLPQQPLPSHLLYTERK